MKKSFYSIFMVLILSLTLFSLSAMLSLTLPSSLVVTEKVVDIPKGTDFLGIVDLLTKEGVVQNKLCFSLFVIMKGKVREMRAGEYLFSNSPLPDEVLSKLVTGEEFLHTLTIPEGYNLFQVARVVENAGLTEEGRFLDKAKDRSFLSSLRIEGSSLEGYLFPDTYRFRKNTGEEDILRAMVNRFNQIYDETHEKRASALGLTKEQVVILASMVEKEAGVSWEKPLIAAVFENRLKKEIKLQSDPTVIYGLTNFNGDLTKEHLNVDTLYNTYRFKGLPPEPIANPGKDSMIAVLYPADVDYLYFVSRNDGTHSFSHTLKEHNQAVEKYQRRLKIPPGPLTISQKP